MNRSSLLRAALALASTAALSGQTTSVPAPQTVIRDSAWTGDATTLASAGTRSTRGSARLANLSVRSQAGSGADTLIAGASVQGAGNLPILVRAIGPGLAQFGVSGYLRSVNLDVYRSEVLSAQTNTTGPGIAAASTYVGAFPLLERTSAATAGDAALVGRVSAGTLTAHCSSAAATSGIALLEFYDATATPVATSPRFVNLSARARVEAGEGLIVIGFVVTGEGNTTLLLRGIGPSLQQFGLTGWLRDPSIELYAGSNRIATNNDWRGSDPAEINRLEEARLAVGAFALTSASDAALLVTLPAGAYTLQVRGSGSDSGVALAEIHEISRTEFDAAPAINAVGLDLFRQLARAQAGQNLIVSPYSIESALALAYAGAAGSTRDEMASALRLPSENTSLQAGFATLRSALDTAAADARRVAEARTRAGQATDPLEWSAANRLFGQQGYTFRESFLTLMRDGFAAPFQAMDFKTNPEPPRLAINAWVEEQTRQKITNLIPSGGLTNDTRLVLVNALYLKAPWDTPFTKSATAARAFRLATGTSRDVATMQRTGSLGYASDDGFTVVTLDYLGQALQCVIILPDEGQYLDTAAARLTASHFARWAKLSDTSRRQLALYLPKFRVKGDTLPLGVALRAIGVKSAFDEPRGSANFDGIAPRRPDEYLAMSQVYHQTYVALDEEGTEAAAATAVVIVAVTSLPPPPLEVRIDRPFFFAIQHRASGACLFFGRVMDPQ